ncbi:MAG TPA: hypothetical protein VIO11_11280 [Candidatus Methanoperedens sp.]
MTKIKFKHYLLISASIIASAIFLIGIVSATEQPVTNGKSNESGSSIYFSKIYIDGFNANSNGFKLLLRTYERRMDTYFQPFLVDIEFVLMDEGKIIYQDTMEQVSLLSERQGTTEITNQPHTMLKEGKNYTALVKVYLHEEGVPRYYVTATSSFMAKNDAIITEVYGDSIGASATIKSKSMVPLNATVVFTLTRNGRTLETKEIIAPSIMSHDKEKTVNILWDRNLDNGIYIVSVALQGNDLIVNYDKVFTVEKRAVANSTKPVETSDKNLPGFTSFLTGIVIISLIIQRGLKRGG